MAPAKTVSREVYSILITSLFIFLSGLLMAGCSGNGSGNNGKANGKLVSAVEAVQSRYGSLPLTERMSGLVRARNQVELYPQISATVIQVYVQNGDLVKAGQPLVRLRDTEYRELLKQAEANYEIAVAQAKQAEAELQRVQREHQRAISLAEKDLISPTEFETIETQAIAAEASAELARARVQQMQAIVDERKEELSRTLICAPVEGSVGNRNAEIGMLVTPSTKLFTLGQLDSVRVEVNLTDHMLSYIREHQRTEILSRSIPMGMVTSSVARISPFLHPVTHSTTAEIDLANPDEALKPGMFVTVDVFYGESEKATLVPLSALWENPATATTGVFVSRDSLSGEPVATLDSPNGGSLSEAVSFDFVPVEIIAKGRMSAGVRGIEAGSWVVTIGQDLLSNDSGRARVRPVDWIRVEQLQQLQREDLLDEVLKRQKSGAVDSSLIGLLPVGREDPA